VPDRCALPVHGLRLLLLLLLLLWWPGPHVPQLLGLRRRLRRHAQLLGHLHGRVRVHAAGRRGVAERGGRRQVLEQGHLAGLLLPAARRGGMAGGGVFAKALLRATPRGGGRPARAPKRV
jgi:hypothetical protein